MHIQNANEAFGRSIELYGHTRPFNMVDGTVDKSFGCVPFEKHLKNKYIDDWILQGNSGLQGSTAKIVCKSPATVMYLFGKRNQEASQ
jgi:hypothetical protein